MRWISTDMTRKIPSFRSLSWGLLWSAAAIACICSLVGFLAGLWWPFELASHLRAQYLYLLMACGVILFLGKRKRGTAVSGVCAIVNVSLIVPLYFGGSIAHGDTQTLRAVFMNVNQSNRAHEKFQKFIGSAKPDFVMLVEVTREWMNALQEMQDDYPFLRYLPASKGRSGVALLSRIPISIGEVGHFGAAQLPSVVARLEVGGESLTVVGAHALSPLGRIRSEYRNQELAALAQIVRSQTGPVMVLADLNTTSWSPFFHDLLRTTDLRDSRIGFGVQPTWPTMFPPLWNTIDRCLVSARVLVHNRKVGPHIGSDHYPVVVDFSIQPGYMYPELSNPAPFRPAYGLTALGSWAILGTHGWTRAVSNWFPRSRRLA